MVLRYSSSGFLKVFQSCFFFFKLAAFSLIGCHCQRNIFLMVTNPSLTQSRIKQCCVSITGNVAKN